MRTRFRDAEWLKAQSTQAVIVGQGGFGAYLSYLLIQNLPAGSALYVCDGDTVSPHNVGNQFFSETDLGLFKVDAVRERLEQFGLTEDVTLVCGNTFFDSNSAAFPISICASDTMASRLQLYEAWCKLGSKAKLFIDMRSAAQQFQMYVITEPSEAYRETLFSDNEVSEGDCAFRQTPQTSMMSAAICTQAVCNYLSNIPVPFLTKWYGNIMMYVASNPDIDTRVAPVGSHEQASLSESVEQPSV